jgi:5'-3' exonuclease
MTHSLLLDASSLMFRAFFSMPTSVTAEGGIPVNAVHGYLDWTANLIGSRHPDGCIHVYDDDWRPAPRVAAYQGYKAARPPDPEALPRQWEILREVLDAFGQPQADAPGWEAEDAIGSLCARGVKADRFDIVTGDRDLIQLVKDPTIRVLFTVRGVSELRVLDEAGVLERFGVPADRYLEYAILRGDPSDGLPGVRGIGEKTARALVLAYPTLDALVQDAAAPRRTGKLLQRSPTLCGSIRDSVDYLDTMREIVPIRTDAKIRTWSGERDDQLIDELAKRYSLGGPTTRLRKVLDARRT